MKLLLFLSFFFFFIDIELRNNEFSWIILRSDLLIYLSEPRNISILVEGCGEGIDIIHNAEIFVHHANNRRSFLVTVVLVSWLDRD